MGEASWVPISTWHKIRGKGSKAGLWGLLMGLWSMHDLLHSQERCIQGTKDIDVTNVGSIRRKPKCA